LPDESSEYAHVLDALRYGIVNLAATSRGNAYKPPDPTSYAPDPVVVRLFGRLGVAGIRDREF
jgi:hypothetical protein